METRIPASERTSHKLNELLAHGVVEGDARSELIKLAVRKIIEEALEAEVAEAVGRGYYESGAAPGAGYRNGDRRGRLRTAEGAIEYGVPQVADRSEPFVSRVRAGLAGRTAELEQLAVEMYAPGLSRADPPGRATERECVPRQIIQQGSDLTVHQQAGIGLVDHESRRRGKATDMTLSVLCVPQCAHAAEYRRAGSGANLDRARSNARRS